MISHCLLHQVSSQDKTALMANKKRQQHDEYYTYYNI